MNTNQFKEPLSFDFYNGDTAKNPVVFPVQWLKQEKPTYTIPHIVGVVVIALAAFYSLIEAGWLLVKAFMESVR